MKTEDSTPLKPQGCSKQLAPSLDVSHENRSILIGKKVNKQISMVCEVQPYNATFN
jgi:hypothetical protein